MSRARGRGAGFLRGVIAETRPSRAAVPAAHSPAPVIGRNRVAPRGQSPRSTSPPEMPARAVPEAPVTRAPERAAVRAVTPILKASGAEDPTAGTGRAVRSGPISTWESGAFAPADDARPPGAPAPARPPGAPVLSRPGRDTSQRAAASEPPPAEPAAGGAPTPREAAEHVSPLPGAERTPGAATDDNAPPAEAFPATRQDVQSEFPLTVPATALSRTRERPSDAPVFAAEAPPPPRIDREPDLVISQLDVFVAAPPAPAPRSTAASAPPASTSQTSRKFLRRL